MFIKDTEVIIMILSWNFMKHAEEQGEVQSTDEDETNKSRD